MSNQPPSRPWFRLATLARASQPQTPASAPAPQPSQPQTPAQAPATRPQTQPAAPAVPRPALMRPTFRPSGVTQPPPAQEATPQALAPSPSASVPQPSVTSAARSALATVVRPVSSSPAPPPTTTTSAPRAPAPATPAAPSPATRLPPASATTSPPAPAIRSPPASATTSPPAPAFRSSPPPTSPVAQKSTPTSSMPSPPQPPSSSPVKPKIPPSSPVISRSVPASPPKPLPPSSPPKVTSPSVKQMTPPTMPTTTQKPSNGSLVTARAPIPAASPRTAKPLPETPPQSPKMKPSTAPPSPFALPPSQMKSEGERGLEFPSEAEKKTVHVQQTGAKPKQSLESHGFNGGFQTAQAGMYVKQKDNDFYKKSSDSEDSGVRIITIAGENQGAVMELGYSPRSRGSSLGSPHKAKSGGDQLSEGNNESSKLQARDVDAAAKAPVPMHAFMNSNVQGINSSIVVNSTFSHHDPGVHLSITRKPLNGHGHGFQLKDRASGKNNFQKEKGQRYSE